MSVPDHLSEPMKGFFRRIQRKDALQTHDLTLLTLAAEAHDRMTAASALIAEQGLTRNRIATDRCDHIPRSRSNETPALRSAACCARWACQMKRMTAGHRG